MESHTIKENGQFLIDQEDPPEHFAEAWYAARNHIERLLNLNTAPTSASEGNPEGGWLRSNLNKPLSDHLSFRLGNQIFMVYVDPYIEGQSTYPCSGNRRHLFLETIDAANAFGCILRMDRSGEAFAPFFPDLGMIDISTNKPIDPLEKVTNELIEMTDWELLDFGIQIVRNHLTQEGKRITEWQSNLGVDPNIWFEDSDGWHWIVVRTARYPELHAPIPPNIAALKELLSAKSDSGFFASVAIAGSGRKLFRKKKRFLYRGRGLRVRADDLRPL